MWLFLGMYAFVRVMIAVLVALFVFSLSPFWIVMILLFF